MDNSPSLEAAAPGLYPMRFFRLKGFTTWRSGCSGGALGVRRLAIPTAETQTSAINPCLKFLIQIRSSASSESHHIAPYYIWITWTDVKCYVWRCVVFHVARPASGTAGMLGWSKEVSLEASYAVLKTITWRHKEAPAALPSGSIWMVHSHSFLMCWSKLPSFFLIKSQIHLIY